MPPLLTREGDALSLSLSGCRGGEFMDAKEKIASIPGRNFDWDTKLWSVPATPDNAERILKTIRPDCDPSIINWIRENKTNAEESLTTPIGDDADDLLIAWADKRMPWQPEVVNDEKFNGALPYQRAAIRALALREHAILADDMGLGKTFEALSAIEEWCLRNTLEDGLTAPSGAKLIVAPKSVRGGWVRELKRWLEDPNIVVLDDSDPEKRHVALAAAIQEDAWIIVNWEQLRIKKVKVKLRNGGKRTITMMKEPLFQFPFAADWNYSLKDWSEDPKILARAEREAKKLEDSEKLWLAVVADEAHRAKTHDSLQAQGLHRTHGRVEIAATGTPLMNAPNELWSILHWLWPDEYGKSSPTQPRVPYWNFYDSYVDYWEDHFKRKVVTGVKNPEALRFVLKDKLIRRTSAILGLKGRKRIFYDVPLNKAQQKLYSEAETAMWLAIRDDIAAGNKEALEFARKALVEGADAMTLLRIPNGAARMVRLRQIIENAALLGGPDDSANMDDFEQKFEDSRPEPWVYFFEFVESCHIYAERLRAKGAEVGIYTGETAEKDRTAMEDAFQRGEIDAIVGTIGAMREGITLTNGHLQAWGSRAWVPAWNDQGESRSDRLGQQRQVLIYIPEATDSVATSKIAPANKLKEAIVATVTPQNKIKEVRA